MRELSDKMFISAAAVIQSLNKHSGIFAERLLSILLFFSPNDNPHVGAQVCLYVMSITPT